MDRRQLLLAGLATAGSWHRLARAATAVATPGGPAVAAARRVLERWLGAGAGRFRLGPLASEATTDAYEYSARAGRVAIRGNSAIALTRGAYDYLRRHGPCLRSWSGDRCALPERLPDASPVHRQTPFALRQYFNVCTFGYSTVWWDWPRWERELDWMALHGLNMPLAMTGQEAVWNRVWAAFGLGRPELADFYTGPAFLPWQRMGNLDGHGGPLSDHWIEQQRQLQHRILARARELGMRPVAPAFSGFVPAAFQRHHPDAHLVTNSSWAHFAEAQRTHSLAPTDPRFVEIGRRFIREYEREYGAFEFYLADSFNELDVPVSAEHRHDELAAYGAAVYRSIAAGNPAATWVMQGWLFHDKRAFWDGPSVQALLRDVPDERMIILDLSNELFHGWEAHQGFYGKRWIYGVIHSFGGNTPWHGDLGFYAADAARTQAAGGGGLVGYGMAPEGIENNEVVYELMADAAWSLAPIDLGEWLEGYQLARYGAVAPDVAAAWRLLREEVYSTTVFLCKHAFQTRPSLSPRSDIVVSARLRSALDLLLGAPAALQRRTLFRNDLVDVAARYVGAAIDRRLQAACAAHRAGDLAGRDRDASHALALMRDLDGLLAVRPELRLERWLAAARGWAGDAQEAALLERNARLQVTVWGGPDLYDYASKLWSGLLRDFYVLRWERFFELLRGGVPDAEIDGRLARLELEWADRQDLGAARAVDDVPAEIHRLLRQLDG